MNLPDIVHKNIAQFLPSQKSPDADIYFLKHSGCVEGTHEYDTPCNICDTITYRPNTKFYLFFVKGGNRYIYSKYLDKVKTVTQKINDNIFDVKYNCSWEYHDNFEELWGRLTKKIKLKKEREIKINKLDIEKLPSNHIFFQLHKKSPLVDKCYQLYEICNIKWEGMYFFFAELKLSDEMKEFQFSTKFSETPYPIRKAGNLRGAKTFEIKGVKANSLLIHEKIVGPTIKHKLCSINKIYNKYTSR